MSVSGVSSLSQPIAPPTSKAASPVPGRASVGGSTSDEATESSATKASEGGRGSAINIKA